MNDSHDDDSADLIGKYLSTANRPIRLRLGFADGVSNDVLLPQRVDGIEAICDGIEMRIYCLSLDEKLPLKTLIGIPAELQFVTDQGDLRGICGIVAEASQGESDGGLASYQLVLRDALAILDLAVNTRVFLDKNELDVVRIVLDEARGATPALAAAFEYKIDVGLMARPLPKRRQIIQYNEGTGAFLRRLLKRRGISWFFRAGSVAAARAEEDSGGAARSTPAHTMVMFQDGRRLQPCPPGVIRYHRDSATEQRDTITAWSGVRTLRPGRVSRHSWDYANPRGAMFMSASATSAADQGAKGNRLSAKLDHYQTEAPHVRDSYAELQALAQQAMARSDFEAKCYHAESAVRDCAAGEYFSLDGHPDIDRHPDAERQFIILARHITAQNNLPKGYDARVARLFARNRWSLDVAGLPLAARNWFDSGEMRYLARMTCVRRDVAFAPAYDARVDLPQPHMQSGVVVGPAGEAVHCDAQGRVKVRLSAMREQDHAHAEGAGASGTERDSAWVRVASNWAGDGKGGHFGALALPRAGAEVLIAFLGGDPDKPIIIGQLYNMIARPPRLGAGELPGNRYLSGIRSREIGGARANQLRFDDTAGQISAQLASEHATSQLNLGWLTQPRDGGKGAPRGEGAELRSDDAVAIRAGKGMLLSAWARLNGGGQQLDRAEYLSLMEDCLQLFRSLGQCAAQNQSFPIDDKPQGEARAAGQQWGKGSNAAPKGAGAGGGAAAIAVTAPDGISFATSKAIVSYAAANIDTVAQQHVQMVAGQRFNVSAGKGVSLFAQQEGLTAIANYGRLLLQSQHDSTQLDSAKDVKISAKGRVIIMAEEVVLMNAAGAYISLKGGAPEIGGPGALEIKTAGHHWGGAASRSAQLPAFGEGDFGRKPTLVRALDGQPVEGMEVHVERDGVAPLSGTSDAAGHASGVSADRVQQLLASFYKPRT